MKKKTLILIILIGILILPAIQAITSSNAPNKDEIANSLKNLESKNFEYTEKAHIVSKGPSNITSDTYVYFEKQNNNYVFKQIYKARNSTESNRYTEETHIIIENNELKEGYMIINSTKYLLTKEEELEELNKELNIELSEEKILKEVRTFNKLGSLRKQIKDLDLELKSTLEKQTSVNKDQYLITGKRKINTNETEEWKIKVTENIYPMNITKNISLNSKIEVRIQRLS